MLTTKEVKGVRVCRPHKPGKEYTKDGLPRHRRKIGKIYKTVFSPDGLKVVGFIVRRPDLLWMFKRPERFLALDAMDIQDGLICPVKGMDSWDERAIKRLDVDYETCIIWEGMDVKTSDGRELGRVDEISFDERTGELNSLFLDDGGTARAIVGSVEIPMELMVGYKNGVLVVQPEAAQLLPTGGLAAKAGEATAKIGAGAKEGAKKAGQVAGKAVDKGSYGLGKLIGRAKRSVTGAVDGFRQEMPAEKPAPKASSGSAAKSGGAKAGAAKASATKASGGAKAGAASKGSAAKAASGAAKPAASGKAGAAKSGASGKAGAAKSSSGKSASTGKSSSSKSASTTKSAGKAVSDHMKAAGSMFSDFKKEFDKASKGK